MSRWPDDEDELDETEDPDEADVDGDEESETLPCSACGEPVYEDAERCCHCGEYISPSQAAAERRPWWFIVALILALLAVLTWLAL